MNNHQRLSAVPGPHEKGELPLPIRRSKTWIRALVFFVLLLCAQGVFAAENPWGHTRVLGYAESIPANGARMFTPFAVLQDVAYAKDMNLYLHYKYARYENDMRLWQLWLTDASGKKVSTRHKLSVILPYPSIWSAEQGDYWKWTKNYASRYDWYYADGISSIRYKRKSSGQLGLKETWFISGEWPRRVQKMTDYGCQINLGKGFEATSICYQFVDEGSKPKKLRKTNIIYHITFDITIDWDVEISITGG